MCFDVPVILKFNSLQVGEYDAIAVGSTLNEDESEKQVLCKLFSELEKAALVFELVWSDNQAITKWSLDLTCSQTDPDMSLSCQWL